MRNLDHQEIAFVSGGAMTLPLTISAVAVGLACFYYVVYFCEFSEAFAANFSEAFESSFNKTLEGAQQVTTPLS